jgi:hypothetical protein
MGRRSREHRERRERRERRAQDAQEDSAKEPMTEQKRAKRADELEEDLNRLAGGDAIFWTSGNCPAELRESILEDILAFELTGSGTSLFEGLQEHGLELPPPEKLDELQSTEKVSEVLRALACLRIFLIGFEDMTAREFYSTLWNQTLWEGCYVEKRNPGALTVIDVSHRLSRPDLLRFLEDLQKSGSVH